MAYYPDQIFHKISLHPSWGEPKGEGQDLLQLPAGISGKRNLARRGVTVCCVGNDARGALRAHPDVAGQEHRREKWRPDEKPDRERRPDGE